MIFTYLLLIAVFLALYKKTWIAGMIAAEFIVSYGFDTFILFNAIELGAGFDFSKMLISSVFIILFLFVNSKLQAVVSFLIAMYYSLLGFEVLPINYYSSIIFIMCLIQLVGHDGFRGLANGFKKYRYGTTNDRNGNDSKRVNSVSGV